MSSQALKVAELAGKQQIEGLPKTYESPLCTEMDDYRLTTSDAKEKPADQRGATALIDSALLEPILSAKDDAGAAVALSDFNEH